MLNKHILFRDHTPHPALRLSIAQLTRLRSSPQHLGNEPVWLQVLRQDAEGRGLRQEEL